MPDHPAASRTPLRKGLPLLGGLVFYGLALYLFGPITGIVVTVAVSVGLFVGMFVVAIGIGVVRNVLKGRAEVGRPRD